jgi:DNA polymerase eta
MARVIVHVDLDAFYAAVEQVRLGLPIEQPLAVQQWEGLIAVNYAARAKGVTRFMAIHEAKQKCPELKLVHVEVIGGSSKREEGKVSLERYRQASANILPIFHRFSPLCEKASIDEAYLDLTAQVEALLTQNPEPETAPVYNNQETASASSKSEPISMGTVQARPDVIVLDGPLNPSNEYDRRLLAGATIVAQLREAVFHELGYTCSAGIAPNKLLAKLASAMNKPYKQTVVTPRAIPGLMQDFPMKKIRNLGGKMVSGIRFGDRLFWFMSSCTLLITRACMGLESCI